MALDRDLGVAFVRALGRPPGDGWEATAATGVRGLRLLRETDGFSRFVFTDASARTVEVLRQNVAGDARASVVLGDGGRSPESAPFGYVDVDPYGSPLPFLAAAVAATRTGGILAVTATDMLVLAGAQAEACRRRYGAEPVRGRLGPEGALRILLMVLARSARTTGRSARALLAYVGSHHVRAYVELGAATAGSDPVSLIDPAGWDGPRLKGSGPFGPLWTGPIVDPELARRLVVPATASRPRELGRLIERLKEDAEVVRPFYFEGNELAGDLGLAFPPPGEAVLAELRHRGHRAGRTHVRPEGLRTDAPRSVVEEVARSVADARQSQNARVRA